MHLANLGVRLAERFERSGNCVDVDIAIAATQKAVDLTPPDQPNLCAYLSNLGTARFARFEQLGHVEDLNAAIATGQLAVDVAPVGHPSRALSLTNLANALRARFEQAGTAADLEAAIAAGQLAVALTPSGHANRAAYLSNLGDVLRLRFLLSGSSADLRAAMSAAQQAVDATPASGSDRARYLSGILTCLLDQWKQAGDSEDLDAAVAVGQQVVQIIRHGNPDRPIYLSNLATARLTRFQQSGRADDLDAAITAGRQAVDLAAPGHTARGMLLSNLAIALLARAGQDQDLDGAVGAAHQAVDCTPPGHHNRAMYLSNLGLALFARFERAGDEADLDAAVAAAQQATDATAPGDANRAGHLSNLANVLRARFERTMDDADLSAAVAAVRQAVSLRSQGHPERVVFLSNLSTVLRVQFEHTGSRDDLDAAIGAGQEAVSLVQLRYPHRADVLTNLGAALLARFEQSGDPNDLDGAITAAERAVDAAAPGDPRLCKYLTNLANCLHGRFTVSGSGADLDAAITAAHRALTVALPGDPDMATVLANLAGKLFTRYQHGSGGADLDAAARYWRQASHTATGMTQIRLTAAFQWGVAVADTGRWSDAADGFAQALALLPNAAWHGLNRATREEQLAQWAGLAADAAASVIMNGCPRRAVELLEQGRSVLWTQALSQRGDLTRLAETHPALARQLDGIRAALDDPAPKTAMLPAGSAGDHAQVHLARRHRDAAELRRRKAREWDDTLARIRSLEGFEHFLAATPFSELTDAANEPVVVLNVSSYGCHALIVDGSQGNVSAIDLPHLSLDTARTQANAMLQALADTANTQQPAREQSKDPQALLGILGWLWDVIAEPVLTAIGHTTPPAVGSTWPRVRWCPTGPLAILPIHAAGCYPHGHAASIGTDTVLDRVVSSYTPTLAALSRARRPQPPGPIRHLTVGMPVTPNLPPLPAVTNELRMLARHFPDSYQLTGSDATRASVLAEIATHNWIHLACHASQHPLDPSRSGFALSDGILTITDLAAQPTRDRTLAFLSACQTATGSARHLDESLHLAAALQFIGYQHVIATMWTTADTAGLRIADAVYATLTADGTPDPGRAAEALHHAIRSVRKTHPASPLLWAPYIHLGS